MTYVPADGRYDGRMVYRRCGASGLKLPGGLARPLAQLRRRHAARDQARDLPHRLRRRHHPLRPRQQLRPAAGLRRDRVRRDPPRPTSPAYRDELIISTKAGYLMWPGPYGEWGSRKYLLASLDQSLERMGLDYVDIFYSHRFDPDTPLEETMGALDAAVRSGKRALRRHLLLQLREDPRGGGDPEGPRHPLRDPPAELQHDQPLGGARRAEGRR